jgi:hypothetical protein
MLLCVTVKVVGLMLKISLKVVAIAEGQEGFDALAPRPRTDYLLSCSPLWYRSAFPSTPPFQHERIH